MTGGEGENKAKSGPHWKSSFAGVRCCTGQWKEVRLRNWKKQQVTGGFPASGSAVWTLWVVRSNEQHLFE